LQDIDHGNRGIWQKVYICVGRMYLFCIHANSLAIFIKNGNLEYANGTEVPEVQAYKDMTKVMKHPKNLILCEITLRNTDSYRIKTDSREKFVEELVVHIRTDHVFRTWTPATTKAEDMIAESGRGAKEATIDLTAPPNGYSKNTYSGYFFFLPSSYEKGGANVFSQSEVELTITVNDARDVAELSSREFRQLQQFTEHMARSEMTAGSGSLNFVNVTSSPYTKRMNLGGDLSSWSAYQVWHKVGKSAANLAVIGLRRKFVPSNGNQYQDIFLCLKSKGGEASDEADITFIETIRKAADALSAEAPSGQYDRIVISQTAKSLDMDGASLLWFLQRLSLLPELGWGWEGAQVQFVRWLIRVMEGENNVPGFLGVADEEFAELCMDEYGDDMPGIGEEPFADAFKDFIMVLPPLSGAEEGKWNARVAGHLGHCADNGILPDYITFEKLLLLAAYKENPEGWKHVGQEPENQLKLKEASEKIQHLMLYFLAPERADIASGQAKPDARPEEEEEEEREEDAPLPPLLKPKLYIRDPENPSELMGVIYNEAIMTRLIETGYLRWDFLPRQSDHARAMEEAARKGELKKYVKSKQLKSEGGEQGEAETEVAPKSKKAPTVDQIVQTVDSGMKKAYAEKDAELASGGDPIKYDEKTLQPKLQNLLYEWEQFPGWERLPAKDKLKYQQAGTDLMVDVRLIQLCHERARLVSEYFQVLLQIMDFADDSDLLCAVAMEIATLTNQLYEQRRKQASSRSHFNAANLTPYYKNFGGGSWTNRSVVGHVIRIYIMKVGDDYRTLCGMRALINLAALSDECKMQILGKEDCKTLKDMLDYRVRDYKNNESVLATFCMLLRNICSSAIGRQHISRTPKIRSLLVNYMFSLLNQESLKMAESAPEGWEATGSDSRNLMVAEACACLWKMVQPYEPDVSRKQREELEKKSKKGGKKGGKQMPPNKYGGKYLESFILEDVVNGKHDFITEIHDLLEAQIETDDNESSNMVIEKACGLTMALAAADETIDGMDCYKADIFKSDPPVYDQINKLRSQRQSSSKSSKKKVEIRKVMGKQFVDVLCEVLLRKNRCKPVVEKAAGALCVILAYKENIPFFKEKKEALESFLAMSITKQEKQLQNLVNRLNLYFSQ